MKTSISHIPKYKQGELLQIVDIIASVALEQKIWVEMIILFGSYARWDFVVKDVVREWNNTFEYKSDFDILVITRKPAQEKNLIFARKIQQKISEFPDITSPASILVEDIYHINARLEENRYFYLDIKREGILLYDSGKLTLKNARDMSPEEMKKLKQEDFTLWFSLANEFFIDYQNAFERESYKIAVFYLHQATEWYMTAYLLVKTGYKPKSHDLGILYEKLKEENWEFHTWFLLEEERQYFELLRRAYVDSRYSKEYFITRDDILILEDKVRKIHDIVDTLCENELNESLPIII